MMKKRAQTVLEFGLFGAIIIVVFGVILSYSQRLNDRQYTLMKNFRNALKKAHDGNAVVSYTSLEDRFHVNVNSPFEGSRATISASNQVYWAVPEVGEDPNSESYYAVNDEEILLGDGEVIDSVDFAYRTDVTKVFEKDEENETITTSWNVDVDEDRTYQLGGSRTINQRARSGGSRTWETEY